MNLNEMAQKARAAFYTLSSESFEARNRALLKMRETLEEDAEEIFAANREDLAAAREEGLAAPLMQRLKFDRVKMDQVREGLQSLAGLPDPIGETVFCHEITEGLKLYRVTCPIGVVGVIFESRPDALVQIASLTIKSGNASLLTGGRESLRTNSVLIRSVRRALEESGLPSDAAQLMETR